ncbi:hypothetical protein ACJ2_15680 [Pantoea sp. QMID2]|nr:hypothetical protein ACJ3_23680 [Pantoea sp. QMID3]GME40728.1 hypothetical protein ACJ1_25990 [Pantoea sp. QMID1]GME54303.1 hypothetical protein ACJ4_15660 [Pantoea sp. QMID4]GME55326.1 hypothetical protein ACJ2_15680 [Pantoea sp. QMID2]
MTDNLTLANGIQYKNSLKRAHWNIALEYHPCRSDCVADAQNPAGWLTKAANN